jgi:hypothetical protein
MDEIATPKISMVSGIPISQRENWVRSNGSRPFRSKVRKPDFAQVSGLFFAATLLPSTRYYRRYVTGIHTLNGTPFEGLGQHSYPEHNRLRIYSAKSKGLVTVLKIDIRRSSSSIIDLHVLVVVVVVLCCWATTWCWYGLKDTMCFMLLYSSF